MEFYHNSNEEHKFDPLEINVNKRKEVEYNEINLSSDDPLPNTSQVELSFDFGEEDSDDEYNFDPLQIDVNKRKEFPSDEVVLSKIMQFSRAVDDNVPSCSRKRKMNLEIYSRRCTKYQRKFNEKKEQVAKLRNKLSRLRLELETVKSKYNQLKN